MTPESRVRVWPPKTGSQLQVVVRFEDGNSWCETGQGTEQSKFDANTGKVRLILQDPVFGVTYEDPNSHTATVKVQSGYVEVSKLSGSDPGRVIVGAGQQVSVPNGGEAGAVEKLELTAADNAAIADLPAPPAAALGRPSSTGSPELAAMFRNGTMTVFLENDVEPDTSDFATRFFTLLSKSWHVSLRLTMASPAVIATVARRPGTIGVVRDLTSFAGFDQFAFLVRPMGTPWLAVYPPDEGFGAALTSYVSAIVADGDYGKFYRAAFGVEPSYRPLEPVLFGR
jgi:hypothetical protein